MKALSKLRNLMILCLVLACQGEEEAIGVQRQILESGAALKVKVNLVPRHRISPYIYGFGTYMEKDRAADGMFALRPSLYRWGGNTSERFNWRNDSWNAGNDWYFVNAKAPAPGMIDRFMAENRSYGVASVVTLPLLGWVAKDGTSVGFPTSRYPKQQQSNNGAGNGIGPDGEKLKSDPSWTSIPVTSEFVADWVKHLKGQFGNFPHFYIIGNEPMLWHETHRDVHPTPATYDSYLQRYLATAIAVRKADPQAVIIGPALWGWLAVEYSAFDMPGPLNGNRKGTDRAKHGGTPFLEWFLMEVVRKERQLGTSLIDIVDVHYYPQSEGLYQGDDGDTAKQKLRIASVRSLWDRNHTDNSWIKEKLYFIPRLKQLITKIKPALTFAIGEYNFRGEKDFSGVVAQAETLGVFAEQNLYMAEYWTDPPKDSLVKEAFRLFRNYDGKGGSFGSYYLLNNHGIKDDTAVFAGIDPQRKATVVVINKSTNRRQDFQLELDKSPKVKWVRVYTYDHRHPGGIKVENLAASTAAAIKTEPLSIQLVEFLY